MPPPLSPADQERLRAAVAEAERRTAGEIVPYVVARCDTYEIALWRGAVAGGLLAGFALVLVLEVYGGWGLGWAAGAWGMFAAFAAGGVLGAVLPAAVPAVRRTLAGRERLARTVHLHAEAAFLEEEVFATRARTGILLFVALLEHRIEVIADRGVVERVDRAAWEDVVARIRAGIERGDLVGGLCDAVARCGELLEASGLAPHADAPDELPNEVRLRRS